MKLVAQCDDCKRNSLTHITTWIEGLMENNLAQSFANLVANLLPEHHIDHALQTLFTTTKLLHYRQDFQKHEILSRSWFFIQEAKNKGIMCEVLFNIAGATNHLRATLQSGKQIYFDSLPNASHTHTKYSRLIDDKAATRRILLQNELPMAPGKSFWWHQKKHALQYATQLGFPLIVKPSNGSVSCHVTTNIMNVGELELAIAHSLRYGPQFILERHMSGYVVRGTVINNNYLACLQQIPAHVIGDGRTSIQELIKIKNNSKKDPHLYHDIVVNTITYELLENKKYDLNSIPKQGELVALQRDPFLKLGGDLKDVTQEVHPDNKTLFFKLAELFNLKLVGIDFIAKDISRSWKEQECAILELNSSPAIEMHHLPSIGAPQNPAGALVEMMLKYY